MVGLFRGMYYLHFQYGTAVLYLTTRLFFTHRSHSFMFTIVQHNLQLTICFLYK